MIISVDLGATSSKSFVMEVLENIATVVNNSELVLGVLIDLHKAFIRWITLYSNLNDLSSICQITLVNQLINRLHILNLILNL